MGPFDRWPTGYGFDYFYGFMAGETSQYEPRLFENTLPIEPPRDETYHLSSDMADKALAWLRKHRAFAPDKPFLMYWAPGAAHGPHHVFKEWADKYKGKFDDGWDAYRERVFKRQKDIGWIPPDTKLTPRADTMASWDSIPESQRPFQTPVDGDFRRLRRACRRAGRQARRRPRRDEDSRQHDHLLCLRRQRLERGRPERHDQRAARAEQIPNTIEQQLEALDKIGGLDGARHRQDRQHVSRGLGLGGRYAVPLHQARRLAFRRHAQSAGRFVAEGDQARQDAAAAVPPRQRHRADDLRHSRRSRRPTWSMDGSNCRSTASAWPTRSATPRRRARS